MDPDRPGATLVSEPPAGEDLSGELSDRYSLAQGRVHLSGIQALVRMVLDQRRRDARDGIRSGTFVSGYEGSPLGGFDLELLSQASLLDDQGVHFEAGLNEELAATAVQGTQLLSELDSSYAGVTGFWYGKAPGLDRATDALRHANLMGTHPRGGAVALVGDDPGAKSSSVPGASEHALADLGIPTLYPADSAEILSLGRHAVALSRASGLWTALKIVTAVADGSGTVDLIEDGEPPRLPEGSGQHRPEGRVLQPHVGRLERDQVTRRTRIVTEYADANDLNRIVGRGAHDRIGIVAAGKTYLDVLAALARLGLDAEALESSGVRLLKLGLLWPLSTAAVEELAEGLTEILVVEEKRAFLEPRVRDALYGRPQAPVVLGKLDADGQELLAPYGELEVEAITRAIATRLLAHGGAGADREVLEAQRVRPPRRIDLPLVQRTPYFCSGCPHNTSTKPYVDSPVGAGIGCHAMVLLMEPSQVGNVIGMTQMGGEGAHWFGLAPFVDSEHFVQNLGDGTFAHSGSLAIRAAVASKRNITYRILLNGTVAMTGGQDPIGQLGLRQLVRNLQSEGVAKIVVTTDEPRRVRRAGLPRDVEVRPRSDLGPVEQQLAAVRGVTVLIHEQECATELRRKRKRGLRPKPEQRVVINERICEGCGDCGVKSNCLSVHPVETEFGRKTAIHQSSCNVDLSCLQGDCPAFMTVSTSGKGASSQAQSTALEPGDLPAPPSSTTLEQQIRLLGIGGGGVVTTSAIIATAAALSGRHVRTLDQTGLAQKGGAVISDVKFSPHPLDESGKVGEGACDLYLGYDVLVASDPRHRGVLSSGSAAIVSTSKTPTGLMVSDRRVEFPAVAELTASLTREVTPRRLLTLDAQAYAERLFGAEHFANMLVLGIAYQLGELALSDRAIERAIELNGVAVEANTEAFRRGRQYAADPGGLEEELARRMAARGEHPAAALPQRPPVVVDVSDDVELERVVGIRVADLDAYQNRAYSTRYERLVEEVRVAETDLLGPGAHELTTAVATYFHKVLAYKDEYEVARLALDQRSRDAVRRGFGEGARASWKLHPPVLRALGMRRKITLGPWFAAAFWVLYRLRGLRGTILDPFGLAGVRRAERRLAVDYERDIRASLTGLSAEHHAAAIELARLPDLVRGYEEVKLRGLADYDAARRELLERIPALTAAVED